MQLPDTRLIIFDNRLLPSIFFALLRPFTVYRIEVELFLCSVTKNFQGHRSLWFAPQPACNPTQTQAIKQTLQLSPLEEDE